MNLRLAARYAGVLRNGIPRGRLGFVAVRYTVAMVAALEALLFARILGPAEYGNYAYVVEIAILLTFVGAGAGSGYVYSYYATERIDDRMFVRGAAVQYVAGIALLAALFWMFKPQLVWSCLLVLIFVPYLITEPMLRVRNRFTLPVLGKGMGYVGTLALLAGALLVVPHGLDTRTAIMVAVGGNLAGYAVYYIILLRLRALPLKAALPDTPPDAGYWATILKPGVPLNLSSVLFLMVIYADRFFIEAYHSAVFLSVYSLAWALVRGGTLLLTSLNLISSVRIGETFKHSASGLPAVLRRQFVWTLAAASGVYALLVAGAWLLRSTVYPDYEQLVIATAIIAGGFAAYQVVGSISPVLFFQQRLRPLIIGNALVLAVIVAAHALTVQRGWSPLVPVLVTTVALTLLSAGLTWHIWGLGMRVAQVPGSGEMDEGQPTGDSE